MTVSFDPTHVDLQSVSHAEVVCYLQATRNNPDGELGARISSVFVVLITSTAVTFFPVVATRVRSLNVPLTAYLIARYFGTGVILATAFVHLLDPAYAEIGPDTCVGMTGNWALYSWPPALVLLSITIVFLIDLTAELYVEAKYGVVKDEGPPLNTACSNKDGTPVTMLSSLTPTGGENAIVLSNSTGGQTALLPQQQQQQLRPFDADETPPAHDEENYMDSDQTKAISATVDKSYHQQIGAFLILEFGVIFHSVIIGLTLGVVGSEFKILYVVIIFHQAFEGLGLGARLSAISFPRDSRRFASWLPWILCLAYGLTTPVAISVGLAIRSSFSLNSFTANIIQGVLNASSAGVLIYTALVELIARDFFFDPNRTRDKAQLVLMVLSCLAGMGLMAFLGKWI